MFAFMKETIIFNLLVDAPLYKHSSEIHAVQQ